MATDQLSQILSVIASDPWIKVAGIDADGVLRGKDISHSKFVKATKAPAKGFGMCSVVFGWDITDELYHDASLPTSNIQLGYPDLVAKVDLGTFRRIPWENNMPFFLVSFYENKTGKPIAICPRHVLSSQLSRARRQFGVEPLAGVEYEFFHYKNEGNSSSSSPLSSSSATPPPRPRMTSGLFTYSLVRPAENKSYYQAIKDTTRVFDCPIDGLHTESGPVYEASLAYDTLDKIGDRGVLFKYLIKCVAHEFNITPTFMAKPESQMPGSSGHVHISLVDVADRSRCLFDRTEEEGKDVHAPFAALTYVSDAGRSFLAGLLAGLPDVLPLLCPTVNSYKRLGHRQYWTASSVSWGVDNRNASVRVVPGGAHGGTRFECRVPEADASAPYVLAALIGCGLRGMEKGLAVETPPLEGEGEGEEAAPVKENGLAGTAHGCQQVGGRRPLSRTLKEAVMDMTREGSIAREVLGNDFVEQFAATRMQEVRSFEDVVTDWEVSRYLERV